MCIHVWFLCANEHSVIVGRFGLFSAHSWCSKRDTQTINTFGWIDLWDVIEQYSEIPEKIKTIGSRDKCTSMRQRTIVQTLQKVINPIRKLRCKMYVDDYI